VATVFFEHQRVKLPSLGSRHPKTAFDREPSVYCPGGRNIVQSFGPGGFRVSEASANLVYAYEQWEIDLGRRELRSRGIPVPLGGRAFEIVTVLVQSATELVTKEHMMERVWPGAIVGEGTLHVHISAVRKALGPDRAMLKTVSGRGYRLLGSWTPQQPEGTAPPVYAPPTRTSGAPPANNFPPLITRLIGRAAAAQFVRDLVSAYRVVTLTGPGGIGKTALAVRYLLPDFEDGGGSSNWPRCPTPASSRPR
jgi:DNA-binding winged helix-turn-helix (wHTH) protein